MPSEFRIQPGDIYLSNSKIKDAGRGVFAARDFSKDEIVEVSPVVELQGEAKLLADSGLYNYYFIWGNEQDAAIALGFGSLYNHSYSPNATYTKQVNEKTIYFLAIEDIKKDGEITVNYNYGDPADKSPLWIKGIKPPG